MPPVKDMLEMLGGMLAAIAIAALIMAAVVRLGGSKQAPAAAALALAVSAMLVIWFKNLIPLVNGDHSWNRLPWAVLAALVFDRIAQYADANASDGWLIRGGVASGIAWWVIPEVLREENGWMAPAFAIVVWGNWVVLDRVAAAPGSGSVAFSIVLAHLAAGGVLVFAGSGK